MKAIFVTNDDGYKAQLSDIDEHALPQSTGCAGQRRIFDHQLQGRAGHHRQKPGLCAVSPWCLALIWPGKCWRAVITQFAQGDKVLLNGHGVGEKYWGGLAQKARLKSDWLIKLPEGISTRDAMALGTAGYTAMLCIMALEDHGATLSADGEILVTGATGGVGSVAIALLSQTHPCHHCCNRPD